MILQAGGPIGDGPLVGPETVPILAAAVLGVLAVALAGSVLGGPARRRAHAAIGVAIPGALALAYTATVAGVPEQLGADPATAGAVARFTAYTFALLLAAWLCSRLGAAGRELTLVLAVATLGHVGGVAGWLLLDGSAALAAVGTAALLGLVLLYLLVSALGGEVPGARGLLFAKLRGLLVLGWSLVLVVVALSPRGIGTLDAGIAALVGAYLDVVLAGGLGAVVVRSGGALDALAGASSDESDAPAVDIDPDAEPGERPDTATPDAAVGDGGRTEPADAIGDAADGEHGDAHPGEDGSERAS